MTYIHTRVSHSPTGEYISSMVVVAGLKFFLYAGVAEILRDLKELPIDSRISVSAFAPYTWNHWQSYLPVAPAALSF